MSAPRSQEGGDPARARRRRLFRLLAAGVGVLLAALAGEVGLRVAGVDNAARRHFQPGIYRPDPELGWALQPDYQGVHREYTYDAPTTTNPEGFRDRLWDETRRAAPTRILCLGDSCTFGRGVGDHETYPAQLEALLGEGAAVFNSGVPGYDTVQEAALLRRLGPRLRPHWIVLAWLPNDVLERSVESVEGLKILDGHLVHDEERYRVWRRQIDYGGLYRSALYRFARVHLKRLGSSLRVRPKRWDATLDEETLRYSQDALADIAAQARELQARLVVVLFPRQEELRPEAAVRHYALMEAFARDQGAVVVNLATTWRAAGPRAGRFIPRDAVHPTASGYAEVAQAVAAALGTP